MKSCCDNATLPSVRSASRLSTTDADDTTSSSYSIKIPSTWTVGKVSLTFLLLAATGDLVLQQFRGLDNFEDYDALSTDVIRPAFSYKSSGALRSSSLGSAAISSVTDALSPILPFTGGVDLRREEYRASSAWETVQSLYTQTVDAFASSNAFASSKPSMQPSNNSVRRVKAQRQMILSATEPFVKTQVIAELTLADMTQAFRYATESNKIDFDEGKFTRKLGPQMKTVVASMKDAVEKSHGNDVQGSVVPTTKVAPGSLDALKFSAAMRIFAEWRLLRQTPEGYKGFEIGMSLGHKDVVQNVVKIEQAVHDWLDHQSEMEDGSVLRSPTIAQLLQHERDTNAHPNLPRLMDKTAAMGLLWVRRQLEYQTHLFSNALMVPTKYESSKDAVAAAYKEVYDRYHGWAVQKIFSYSFQSAPDAVEICRHMNPRKLKEVEADLRKGKLARAPSSAETTQDVEMKEDENPVAVFFCNIGNNIGNWWNQVTNKKNAAAFVERSDDDEFERLVSAEMVKDASQHITLYMEVVEPLLNDLASVFDQYNMDDPTKV